MNQKCQTRLKSNRDLGALVANLIIVRFPGSPSNPHEMVTDLFSIETIGEVVKMARFDCLVGTKDERGRAPDKKVGFW